MKTAVEAVGSDYAPEEIVDSRTAAGAEGVIVLEVAARAAQGSGKAWLEMAAHSLLRLVWLVAS